MQFVKVGNQFINMERVEAVSDWDGRILKEDALDPTLRVSFSEGSLHFKGQDRADLLAWLNANSADVSVRPYVDLPYPHGRVALADDSQDSEYAKLRERLNVAEKLLRAVDDAAPFYSEQLRTEGYSELANVVAEIRANITPF